MKKTALILGILTITISCNNDDKFMKECQLATIISAEDFESATSDDLAISNLEITNDCLTITFYTSAGTNECSFESWEYKIIDSDDIDFQITTDEPLAYRILKFSLNKNEDCEGFGTFITEEASFDISNLRVEGENSVKLIIGFGISFFDFNSITHEY